MKTSKASILILLSLCICNIINATTDSNVYIAYLGEKKHDDPQHVVQSHHDLLATVVGSKEEASKLMVHNYKHGFSGFSAILTKNQAKKLAASPDVIDLVQDHPYKPQGSTIASDYLGLTSNLPTNLGYRVNQGEDIIIGIIDTGIWGNNTAGIFSDEGYGPIPARWKGSCEPGNDFDPAVQCNKKVIGAKWFRRGATANGFLANDTVENEVNSPLDHHGHGTFCASAAAGNEVKNVSYLAGDYGTFRGTAPRARIAVYKACYNIKSSASMLDDCLATDVYAAFDQAIHDGVDVISASIGPQHTHGDDLDNYLNYASYHAVMSGIPVVAAAGNMGPRNTTMGNSSPWHLTVAAARVSSEIAAPVTLGNNATFSSIPLSGVEGLGSKKLVMVDNSVLQGWNLPTNNATFRQMVNGSVVFLHEYSGRNNGFTSETADVKKVYNAAYNLGVAAIIIDIDVTNTISYMFQEATQLVYCVEQDVKAQIENYVRSTENPTINIGKPYIREGPEVRTKIESYSSRGPSLKTPVIIKPDIAAPAWGLLGASSGWHQGQKSSYPFDGPFRTMKGTSSATPVVAGLVALVKAEHRDWSPAAIKSAFVTTGSTLDTYGAPILSPWGDKGTAGPFDFGGGLINVQAASDPGLVYDMEPNDYILYLCSGPVKGNNYNITHIQNISFNPFARCPLKQPSVMDVNLPSIGVENLRTTNKIVVTRTTTNVGPEISTYKPLIFAPVGTKITVRPKKLKFNALRKKITYKLFIETDGSFDNYTDGSIIWTDGSHHVRSPIVVLN